MTDMAPVANRRQRQTLRDPFVLSFLAFVFNFLGSPG